MAGIDKANKSTDIGDSFWSRPASELLAALNSSAKGLTLAEAQKRQKIYGPNLLKPRHKVGWVGILLHQFQSPIILILIAASILSYFLSDSTNSIIILTIVLISGMLGFWQENGAQHAIAKLLEIVQIRIQVLRDGTEVTIPQEEIVPGDVLSLNAGDMIAGDCLLLESHDLYIDEATLTGETFPVEKEAGVLPADTTLHERSNTVFMGTHVVSGTALALVVSTAHHTEFGKVFEHLAAKPQEAEFEHGLKHFGFLIMEITLVLVVSIFFINIILQRHVLDSFMFSLALAIGLTPQLLPAIISINLSHGAKRMASNKVIVKQLSSIENFGSMNILCSDKTGTLTEGRVEIDCSLGMNCNPSSKVMLYSYLNAYFETGFTNPIDEAIRKMPGIDISKYSKVDEIPYDFLRKRLSIAVDGPSGRLMISKGAVKNILEVCEQAEDVDGKIISIDNARSQIDEDFKKKSSEGMRCIAVAYRLMSRDERLNHDSEKGMIFVGLLVLYDPPKAGIADTLKRLRELGIEMKLITGDNHLVARNLAEKVGIKSPRIVTGSQLTRMSSAALQERVKRTDIFAEIEPNQKEQIILALRKSGSVVGYIGDGINDASALHAADVGISVESAVDVAKEAAQIVLLEKDLNVLVNGVEEGRRTFANTLKYVFMATSANFGNMFSMAGASLFLPFLPLLPRQILLTNLMTDIPEMTIATDRVDDELVQKPRRWDIVFIRKFMITFGLLSSVFDYLTFGILIFILGANAASFRTGWFTESVISATVIVLVIRTRRPFWRSLPGRYLLVATLAIVAATVALPYTVLGDIFGFEPLPVEFLLMMFGVVALYIAGAEIVKKLFYRWVRY
jgi:P-type Mg2+ transporter